MKKLLILALGAATLSLGACSRRSTCPAYTSTSTHAAPITASTSTSLVSQ